MEDKSTNVDPIVIEHLTKENKELIDSFKNSNVHERRLILYALHDFFLTFEFSAQEKKSFSAKLKI